MKTFLNTTSVDFNSLVGKYICFMSKDTENLKMTEGRYVTNCNYIYYVTKLTPSYIFVDYEFSNGTKDKTKLKRDTFEKDFLDGFYVICDTKPQWNQVISTYTINLPSYSFETSDLSKSFTPDEINELLQSEFLGKVKTIQDIRECLETLGDILMKRHFNDYVSIGSSYGQSGNSSHIGLNIETGHKYLGFYGSVDYKFYRKKVISISFKPSYLYRSWTTLEDLIVDYLTENKEYIDNL